MVRERPLGLCIFVYRGGKKEMPFSDGFPNSISELKQIVLRDKVKHTEYGQQSCSAEFRTVNPDWFKENDYLLSDEYSADFYYNKNRNSHLAILTYKGKDTVTCSAFEPNSLDCNNTFQMKKGAIVSGDFFHYYDIDFEPSSRPWLELDHHEDQ